MDMKLTKIYLIATYIFIVALLQGFSRPLDSPQNYISGAFIQLNESNARKSANWWYQQVDNLYEIGADTIIIQYVAFNNISYVETNDNYYNLSLNNNDPIEHILTRADQRNIEVFIGLGLEDNFNVSYNPQYYQFEFNYNLENIISRAKKMLTRLDKKYGYSPKNGAIHESLVGWYFPTEFNDANVIRSGHKTFRDDIVKYYSSLSLYAHQQTGLETMISPYFAANGSFYGAEKRNPAKYANWWDDVLDDDPNDPSDQFIDIDIIAHQDSVGAGHISIAKARKYFKKLKPVLKRNGVKLWSNNEAFRIGKSNTLEATSIKQFTKQIKSTSRYVAKTIFFEFSTYMKGPGNTLYDDYESYCCR